jgi:hypothetical protein
MCDLPLNFNKSSDILMWTFWMFKMHRNGLSLPKQVFPMPKGLRKPRNEAFNCH